MNKKPNWKKDYSYGTKREKEFTDMFLGPLMTYGGKNLPDVIHWAGATLEIKCERRSSENTPNIAVETIKNTNTGEQGGPWQSTAMYMVYFFSNNDFYIYRRDLFTKRTEELIALGEGFDSFKPNGTYYTKNRILMRSLFKDLEVDWRNLAD